MSAGTLETECEKFLIREASLLDNVQLSDWLKMLSDDIQYVVPVRQSVDVRDGSGFSDRAFYFNEDIGSLRLRIKKLESEYSWSENPRTRTRRMISNIDVQSVSTVGNTSTVELSANIVVFCHRGDSPVPVIVTAERRDRLIVSNGTVKLQKRRVLLDSTVLGLEAFSIFL